MMFYSNHGVSADKGDVHHAVEKVSKGLCPTAFCKIVPDILTGDPTQCCILHADGAGTKSLVAYLYWKETGDLSHFKGISQDALVMNTDDVFCVGATGPILVSSTIGRNSKFIPKEVLKVLIESFESLSETFADLGIKMSTTGGETADLGDLIRTLVVDATIACRMKRSDIIDPLYICQNDIIIGLASFGQTTYETKYNSGIGSNGLTLARHVLLHKSYQEKYPECCDINDTSLVYNGPYKLSDSLSGTSLTIGEALLSPTRSYGPILCKLMAEFPDRIHGIIHCSGGGQTKCLKFGKGLRYVKDNLFTPPPIFQVIQQIGNISLHEMYKVFNMGHRMELPIAMTSRNPAGALDLINIAFFILIFCPPDLLTGVTEICTRFNMECQQIGYVEALENKDGNEVIVKTSGETLIYS